MTKLKLLLVCGLILLLVASGSDAQLRARDPGVRGGPAGAGEPLPGLTEPQLALFDAGKEDFEEEDGITDGLGPRFNLNGCAGCHIQPAMGGTSPAVNPQVGIAAEFNNRLPSFITLNGPVREARFKFNADGTPDGGVHALFVITGDGCDAKQEDFETHVRNNNVVFRIPTPVFGAGLIEQIPDSVILANQQAENAQKAAVGIRGRPHRILPTGDPNRNGNDGTIARFGWKAQNKSLLIFAGEAYNVEQGITNELFPTERDENPRCQFAAVPNDTTNMEGELGPEGLGGPEKFAFFMRFLAPPAPSPTTPGGAASIDQGRRLFTSVGCAYCHTPALPTSTRSGTPASAVEVLGRQRANLYSDLLLHNMGPGLADDVTQGQASGDEFRTAPLWGLGQRIFFLHDGRTSDLGQAIDAHRSHANRRWPASEANGVVDRYHALSERDKQHMMNFLRSL